MKKNEKIVIGILILICVILIIVSKKHVVNKIETIKDKVQTTEEVAEDTELMFQLTNKYPDTTFKEIYFSESGKDEWTDNLLSGQTIGTDEAITLVVNNPNKIKVWDVKTKTEDDKEITFAGLDLKDVDLGNLLVTLEKDESGSPVANISTSTDKETEQEDSNELYEVSYKLVNDYSGTTFKEVYMSNAGMDAWGANMLEGEEMLVGTYRDFTLDMDSENLNWDFKAVAEDGTEITFGEMSFKDVKDKGEAVVKLTTDQDGNPIVKVE